MSLKVLRNNLSELLWAAQENRSLVPSFSGNEVKAVIWYRWVIVVIYKIIDCFLKESLEVGNLQKAIQKTDQLFSQELQNLRKNFSDYEVTFKRRLDGFTVDEKKFNGVKKAIADWGNQMMPLLRQPVKALIEKIKKVSHPSIFKGTLSFEEGLDEPFFAEVEKFRNLVRLESLTANPPPIAAFNKLLWKRKIEKEDFSLIDRWISELNSRKNCVQDLHEGLKAVVRVFPENLSVLVHAASLEWRLQKLGCTVFSQKDETLMSFRKQLQEGKIKTVQIKGKTLEIIKRLGKEKKSEEDRFVVFQVKSESDSKKQVLKVGLNAAIIGIEVEMKGDKEEKLVMPMSDYIDSNDAGLMIEEEGSSFLWEHKWSTTDSKIDSKDAAHAAPMVKWLDDLFVSKQSPVNFCLEHLYLKEGAISTIKPIQKGKVFDINALIQVAVEFADKKPFIFGHLIKESGIECCKSAVAYRECVTKKLLKEESWAEYFSKHVPSFVKTVAEAIRDFVMGADEIEQRMRSLRTEVDALREDCLKAIKESYDIGNQEKEFRSKISTELCDLYCDNNLGLIYGVLPNLKEIVLKKVLKDFRVQKTP